MLLSNHIHRKKGTHPRDTNQVPLANPTFEFETLYSAWSSVVYMGCPGVVADWNPAGIQRSFSPPTRPSTPLASPSSLSPTRDSRTLHIPSVKIRVIIVIIITISMVFPYGKRRVMKILPPLQHLHP